MRRKGISYDKKIEAVERYKRGEGSQEFIAREYGVDRTSFLQWIANYEAVRGYWRCLTAGSCLR